MNRLRRHFLLSGLYLSTLVTLPIFGKTKPKSTLKKTGSDFLVGSHREIPYKTAANKDATLQRIYEDIPGFIVFYNLETKHLERFETPIWAHIYNQSPTDPNLFLGCAKWTPSAIVFNYKEKKVIQELHAKDDARFFGHACFSSDGKFAFLTAHSDKKNTGLLYKYQTSDWQLLEIYPSLGTEPHECLITGPDEMCVVNYGCEIKDSCAVQFFNLSSMTPKNRYLGPRGASHVVPLSDDRYAISGIVNRTHCVLFQIDRKSGQITNFNTAQDFPPKGVLGEGLSLVKVSKDEVAVTVSRGPSHDLLVWNIKKNHLQFINTGAEPSAAATYHSKIFVVTEKEDSVTTFKMISTPQETNINRDKETFKFGKTRHMRVVQI